MSSFPVITDNDMRYYQFRARQKLLLEKEELEWKEFCDHTKANCKTAKKMSDSNCTKEIGIQATPISSKIFGQKGVKKQDTISQQCIKDFQIRIENLERLITKLEIQRNDENVQLGNIIQVPHQSSVSKPSILYDSRMKIIQDSLRASIQRLQSVLPSSLRIKSFHDLKKKECGFYIPHDLQRKRAIARRAYLNSLNQQKLVIKPSMKSQRINKQSYKKLVNQKNQRTLKSNKSDINTKDIHESQDQNIETAADAIMEDLLDETALAFSRIRLSKNKTPQSVVSIEKGETSLEELLTPNTEAPQPTFIDNKWMKIKENLSALRQCTGNEKNVVNAISSDEHTLTEHTTDAAPKFRKNVNHSRTAFINCEKRELHIAPEHKEDIQNHRTEYWAYLHQISRAKKGSFDPWFLSNMVAESILDDCVQDVCKELQDIPGSLISDIFYEEFLQTTI